MEIKMTCPICLDTNKCFEEQQETYSSYLCFNCGFMSDSRYLAGSPQLIENLKKSPKLIQEEQFEDKERGIVWFPSVINMGELGMIYPEGKKDNWNWKLAEVRKLTEEEMKDPQYEGHEHTLDIENATEYGQHEFLDACKKMGIVKDL